MNGPSGFHTRADRSGAYVASIISTKRNEVKIMCTKGVETASVLSRKLSVMHLVTSHELPAENKILDAVWFNDTPEAVPKSRKRRLSHLGPQHGPAVSQLAVLLSNGDVMVVSLTKDTPLRIISTGKALVAISASEKHDFLWVATEKGDLFEVSVLEESVAKKGNFGEIGVLCSASIKGSPVVLMGSTSLRVVDSSRNKKAVLHEFEAEQAKIRYIKRSSTLPESVFVNRFGSRVISCYDISEKATSGTFVAHDEVNYIELLTDSSGKERLFAFTKSGVNVFNIEEQNNAAHSPDTSILVESNGVVLSNATYASEGLVIIWHHKTQTYGSSIPFDPEISVNKLTLKSSKDKKKKQKEIKAPEETLEEVEIDNLESAELYRQLEELLREKTDFEVLSLCKKNDDETNIKAAVKQFESSSHELTFRLFAVVSSAVTVDPSKKSSLAVWLKWLLLAHGGSISATPSQKRSLLELQTSLNGGMQLMPKLLALQGRLQLLKLQAELRQLLENVRVDDADETVVNDSFGQTEESIVYANGENDDFEEEREESDVEVAEEDDS